jgi:hypothetical protein
MPDAPASFVMLPFSHASRHAWALEKYGHLLGEALRQDTSAEAREVEKLPEGQIPAHLVTLILERADPTQNKGMTAWLAGQYAQGKLWLEDLGTANETLTMFRRYAQRLEPTQRDLGRYPSLAAVWEAVIGFANAEEQQISGKAQKALDRDKAYAESRILRQDPDGFTIAVPLTEFAAKWWGRGTRWCTAAERTNHFWHYHQQAPLIVLVIPEMKEKGKFQIWATRHRAHFMDAADKPISDVLITEYWTRFEPVIFFALRKSDRALEYVPKKLRTEEMCRIAVARDGLALYSVPEVLRADEMCRIAVAQNGLALEHVPKQLRTDEMCRFVVAQRGAALEHVPAELRTAEICKIAVSQNGWALRDVPWDLRTVEMCKIAVAQNGRALEYVPKTLRTDEMYRIAVADNGLVLQYVPQKLRTDGLCRIAVAQKGLALQYVPQKLRTEELCRIAVAQRGWALHAVPKKLRTKEVCRIAVAQDGQALEYVPIKLRSEDMCRIAVYQHGLALRAVPERLCTDELCRIAVARYGRALGFVPLDLRTEEMCRIAVKQDGIALECVPEHLRNRINCPNPSPTPSPTPAWDISLLDELVSLLGTALSPARLEPRYA